MAKLKVFAVRDLKVGAFLQPLFMRTAGEALRGFEDAVNSTSAENMIGKHPEDFSLYELGEYDEDLGRFTQPADPNPIGTAVEYKKKTGPKAV